MITSISLNDWKNFLDSNNSGLSTNLFPYTYGCSRYLTDFFIRGFYLCLGYQKDNKFVSTCLFQSCSDKVVVLRGVFTLPSYRKFGYSREILNFGSDLLKNNSVHKIWATCRTENIEFYKKCNFQIDHPLWPKSPCYEVINGDFVKLPTNNHYIYKIIS